MEPIAVQEFKAWLSRYGRSTCDRIMREHLRKRLEGAENRPPRIKVSLTERKNMFVRQSGICPICGKIMHGGALRNLDVDHVDPNSPDFNSKKNFQLTHSGCNRSKGALSVADQAKRYGKTVVDIVRPGYASEDETDAP